MRKWNFIIDVDKCEDCNNCFLACKDEHVSNEWPGYTLAQPLHGHRWMNIMRKERGNCPMIDVAYRPTPCMHCDNAPCIKKAANGAVYKRTDGIVLIDPVKAAGQKDLVQACPYGAIYWNEEKNIPQKCTFCAHLLDSKWDKPRCVQSCPTGALSAVCLTDKEMADKAKIENLETLKPETGTQPRVYYKNLYKYNRSFIGGSVSFKANGKNECAEGALVKLSRNGNTMAETVTDCFGDFKFDNLEENSGYYTIMISFKEYEKKIDIDLQTSVYMGELSLAKLQKLSI